MPNDMSHPQFVDEEDIATIDSQVLSRRIQDELITLVILAAEVQIALGPAIAEIKTLSPSVLRSLQAVDRLQQTLDDLQKVMGHISVHGPSKPLEIEALSKIIKLRHLSHKLFDDVDAPFALSDSDSGEIAWF